LKGRAFLTSCDIYTSLTASDFPDNQTQIHWALSYCKNGRAANFAERIVRQEMKTGKMVFTSWTEFTDKFESIFCPENEATTGILHYYPILLTKNCISEAEQSRAFIRGFQPDLWHRISCRLEIKLPDHDPDDFYSLFEINEAAKHVLHGTSQNSFLQNSVTSTTPSTQPASPYVKAEDLSTLFKQMAQSFLKVLTPQKSMTNHASSSTNAQAAMLDPLSCAFCGQISHFIAQCLVCADYITNEKCKRNPEGKIVLPNGQYTPRSIPGWFIKDRIDE
jgi:hypothetical protein